MVESCNKHVLISPRVTVDSSAHTVVTEQTWAFVSLGAASMRRPEEAAGHMNPKLSLQTGSYGVVAGLTTAEGMQSRTL